MESKLQPGAWSRGAGIDPETLVLALPHQGPTFIDAYYQASTYLVD